jgi:hypothetical protein
MPDNNDNLNAPHSPSLGFQPTLGRKWGAIYALHEAIITQLKTGLDHTVDGTEFTLVEINEKLSYAASPYKEGKLPIVVSGGINNIVMTSTSIAPHDAGEHYIVGTDWWIKTDPGHYAPESVTGSRISPLQAAQLAEAALRSLRTVNISLYNSRDLIYNPDLIGDPASREPTEYLLKPIELYASEIYPDPHIFASYEFDVVDDETHEGLFPKQLKVKNSYSGEV